MPNFVQVHHSRWEISGTLTCGSPLHIGDGDWIENRIPDTDREAGVSPQVASVFTMADGGANVKPYIPGTSLKGWLRSFAERVWTDEAGRARICCLFGERKDGAQGGAIEFHDAPLSTEAVFTGGAPRDWDPARKTCIAPHVVIHRHTGAASHNLLFFEEFVPEGSKFSVTITAERVEAPHLAALLELLARFERDCPARLGGQSSGNYGVVRWQRGEIKGLTQDGLDAWLRSPGTQLSSKVEVCQAEDLAGEPLQFDLGSRCLLFRVTLNFEGGFVANDPFRAKPKIPRQDSDLADVTPRRKPDGKCFLPASSIRGSLRTQAEKIQRSRNLPAGDPSSLKLSERPGTLKKLAQLNGLDIPAMLFGSPGWRALVQPSDFIAEPGVPYRQEFVAIDRFTGGAANKKKFNADALWQPRLKGTLEVDVERLGKCGEPEPLWNLLYFVLRDLADGFITLGFGGAKGFGACTGTVEMDAAEGIEFNCRAFQKLRKIDPTPVQKLQKERVLQPLGVKNSPSGRFFNPYHFIPLDGALTYSEPAVSLGRDRFFESENLKAVSHARYGPEPLQHGRIYCELRNLTPLFIGSKRDDVGEHPRSVFPCVVPGTTREGYPGDPMIPASSIRGLISSLTEAVSNSALRVLDTSRVYSRRSLVNPMLGWNEALSAIGVVVTREHNGQQGWYIRPLCLPMKRNGTFELFWQRVFPIPQLRVYVGRDRHEIGGASYLGVSPTYRTWTPSNRVTADRNVGTHSWRVATGGLEVVSTGTLKPPGGPILLGAVPNVNPPVQTGIIRILGCLPDRSIPATKKHELWLPFSDAATFQVSGTLTTAESATFFEVPKDVIERFQMLADEMTEATRDGEAMKPYEPVGTRKRARRDPLKLQPGDLVYFGCNGVRVTEISFSSIWRKLIHGTAADFFSKVHGDLLPLGNKLRTEPRLTIAEGMFGVSESRETKTKDALVALKSRIRFSNAKWDGEPGQASWMEPACPKILSSPKPPSPAMYFRTPNGNGSIFKRDLNSKGHFLPQGRKFYLHHAGVNDENWKAYPQPTSDNTKHLDQYVSVQPLSRGRTFRFHIDFENLTKKELGLLLFALRPGDAFAHKLGMGKPHGLGSVQITPTSLSVWLPEFRYSEPDGEAGWYDPEEPMQSGQGERFTPSPVVNKALTAIGSTAYVNVRYPVAQNLGNNNALREKIYEWFVANEVGSKNGNEECMPAGTTLEPIGDNIKVPPLSYLPIWPSGENE